MTWKAHRAPLAIALALSLVVFALDFSHRIFVGRDTRARKFDAPVFRALPQQIAGESIRSELVAWVGDERVDKAKPKEILIQAIFYSDNEPRVIFALLSSGDQPSQRARDVQRVRAVKGDSVEGWVVQAIEARRVVLTRGNESRELTLFKRQ